MNTAAHISDGLEFTGDARNRLAFAAGGGEIDLYGLYMCGYDVQGGCFSKTPRMAGTTSGTAGAWSRNRRGWSLARANVIAKRSENDYG